MKIKILQNQVRCLLCGDEPYSVKTHDFVSCRCGAVSVDGGMSYLKRAGNSEDYEELSIAIEYDIFEKSIEALNWSKENSRNELGALCALFRAFRDSGYTLTRNN